MVNAVVWQGAGQGDCENNVSRCMATSSLGSRVSIINHWNIDSDMGHTDGRGISNLCVLEGIEVVLDVNNGCLLDGDSKERIWLRGLGGFWFGGLVGSRRTACCGWGNALWSKWSVKIRGGVCEREHTGVKAIA